MMVVNIIGISTAILLILKPIFITHRRFNPMRHGFLNIRHDRILIRFALYLELLLLLFTRYITNFPRLDRGRFIHYQPSNSLRMKTRRNIKHIKISTSLIYVLIAYTCSCVPSQSESKFRILVNTLRPRQNGRHLPGDSFKWIFLNGNVWISLKISLDVVPKVWINNIPALVQTMAWRRLGDKPLSEPMMVSLLTLIYVTQPQWVNWHRFY